MTPTTITATGATTVDVIGASVTRLRPRRDTTGSAARRANTKTTAATLTPLRPHGPDPAADRDADPPQGTVRIELSDGRVLFGTMIRDYRPAFTAEDYAVLARLRDQACADIARRATGLPEAA